MLTQILSNVLMSLYQTFFASLIVAILCFISIKDIQAEGIKKTLFDFLKGLKNDRRERKLFILIFYVAMILFRTILCRPFRATTLSNPIGNWGFTDSKGNINTEGLENILLMVPFTFLLFWNYAEALISGKHPFIGVIGKSMLFGFVFSGGIELCQLFLKLGDFQLSDIAFNTLGALLGGLLFYIITLRGVKRT